MKLHTILFTVVLVYVSVAASASDRKYIVNPRPAGADTLPFSDAVVVGNTLYVAGHLGLDPKTGQAPIDAEQEARLVMDAVKRTVEASGFSMDDLVTVQVFCTDLSLYGTFNSVYKSYFHGDYPARAFIGAAKLLRGGHFEVMATAVKK